MKTYDLSAVDGQDKNHLKDYVDKCHGTPADNKQIPITFTCKVYSDSKSQSKSIEEMNRRMHDPDFEW